MAIVICVDITNTLCEHLAKFAGCRLSSFVNAKYEPEIADCFELLTLSAHCMVWSFSNRLCMCSTVSLQH